MIIRDIDWCISLHTLYMHTISHSQNYNFLVYLVTSSSQLVDEVILSLLNCLHK
jgi:hypothetical protein